MKQIKMNKQYGLILILLIGQLTMSTAQNVNVSRQVIGSAGTSSSSSTIQISSTIGETVIPTVAASNNSITLTQGFQQTTIDELISFQVTTTNELCIGRADGTARIDSIFNCSGPYTISWSNGASGNRVTNLTAGEYSVRVTSSDGCVQSFRFNITLENNFDCLLRFYSGITPNNDGFNDEWIIDNLELFPSNEVNIYNRVGNRVFQGRNYDNINVVWRGQNLSGADLPSGTYFYTFESGSNIENGWIELTR